VARDVLAAHHQLGAATVALPPPGSLTRCQRITVGVTVRIHAVHLPGLNLGPTFTVTGHHSTIVDAFRDGALLGDGHGCT